MKFSRMITKNLKLLFRNKESAYTIVFGPILIILMVSFAFMGASDDYTIRVGTYAPTHTELSEETVRTLNENNYLVSVYPNEEDCVDSVKTGSSHICMVFSDREAGDDTVPVIFYLDFSRTNLVYQLIDDLSDELNVQADAIRNELASNTFLRLQTGAILVDENVNMSDIISERLDEVNNNLLNAKIAVGDIPQNTKNVTDLRIFEGYQRGFAQQTKIVADIGINMLDESVKMLRELENECDECSEGTIIKVDNFKKEIDDAKDEISLIVEDKVDRQLTEAELLMRAIIDDVNSIQGSMQNATGAGRVIVHGVENATGDVEQSARDIRQVSARLSYTRDFLRGEKVNSSTITTPISTSIVSVTVSDDTLSFAYPYLLVLVIMFIGMLLASMLIVTDKISDAAFRNFTTPTPDKYHVFVSFLTAFIILLLETMVILTMSSFFIAQPLLLNFFSTFALVCVAIVLFTFIGMIIGYLSNTQEAAMITSISIGSVLLFVSNLVIPIEGMTRFAQLLSVINPYIVLSELIKKSMLYGVSMSQVSRELLTLLLFVLGLFVVTVFIQRQMKKRYFSQEEPLLPVKAHIPAPLHLGDTYVYGPVDLMSTLDGMTREDFQKLIKAEENIISNWVSKELRNKRLAWQMRTKSKEKMILRLDRYLKRYGKKLKR